MRLSLILIAIVLVIWAITAQAHDQSFCADILSTRARLAEVGEVPIIAYQDAGIVKVIFGNAETGLWTMVGVDDAGSACTMRNGRGLVVS